MKKPNHAEDQPAVRREQTEAGSPLSMDRRGFLHRSALVIGAFLVGLGRAESAFGVPTTRFVNCCNLCKDNTACPCDNGYLLDWKCDLHGEKWNCIECYDTDEIKRRGRDCTDRTFCSHALCSTVKAVAGDGGISARDRLWQSYEEAGIGCHDPETGEYIIWSEPGTPCDARDPGPPEPSPPELG